MRKNALLLLIYLLLPASATYAAKLDDCNAKLRQLIVTCPNFNNPFRKELLVRIEKQEGPVYTIALFVKSSGQNSESPVGSIRLNTQNNTLVDITYDPDDGVVLKYDRTLYDAYLAGCLKVK